MEHSLDNPEASRANRQTFVVFLQDRIQRKANTGTGNTHEEFNRREDDHLAFICGDRCQMIRSIRQCFAQVAGSARPEPSP